MRSLLKEYQFVRRFSEALVAPLSAEDCAIQSMADVSPTRWHLAHTTWFFETFVLKPTGTYQPFHPRFEYLFNSYYNRVGEQFPRARRGMISRPSLEEIFDYRRTVDAAMAELLEGGGCSDAAAEVITLGLHHEQQHQELMLTDIKHVLSCNPLFPAYVDRPLGYGTSGTRREKERLDSSFAGGLHEIGHAGEGFAYDNESPRHRVFLEPFSLATELVTAGEYLDFIEDGGYRRPELWLSLGWQTVQAENWIGPLYWHEDGGRWYHFTLGGLYEVKRSLPVCHVSYFEADAFARWRGRRLPTEAEWEVAAGEAPLTGHFGRDPSSFDYAIHPVANDFSEESSQLLGNLWQWTASPYVAYPGYAPPVGAIGEYNGKFMCNQYVLRGGSCATPPGHIRRTYRNFFPPEARWQFTGIRLAESV